MTDKHIRHELRIYTYVTGTTRDIRQSLNHFDLSVFEITGHQNTKYFKKTLVQYALIMTNPKEPTMGAVVEWSE